MSMKKTVICALFALSAALAYGQDADSLNFLQRLDRRMYARNISKVDTNYISIPARKWTLYTMTDGHMNRLHLDQHGNGTGYHGTLATDPEIVQKLGFTWHGMGLSVPIFNPKWVFSDLRNKNVDYSLSNFGNTTGFSATLRISDTHKGRLESYRGDVLDIAEGDCHDYSTDLDFYYVANGRKFSMPAAFCFSQIQKKNAGSWIVSAAMRNSRTTVEDYNSIGSDMSITSNMLALGGGFGYNFVPAEGWLIHFSLMGNLVVLKNYEMLIGDMLVEDVGAFPDVVSTSQLAVIKNSGRIYFGIDLINRSALCGSKSAMAFFNSRGNAQVLFGIRL